MDPCSCIVDEIKELKSVFELTLTNIEENINMGNQLKNLSWKGPISLCDGFDLLPSLKGFSEKSESEEGTKVIDDAEEAELMPERNFEGMEPFEQPGLTQLQSYSSSVKFAVYALSACPSLITSQKRLHLMEQLVKTQLVLPLFGGETISVALLFDCALSGLKVKGLSIDKDMPQKAGDAAVATLPGVMAQRRALLITTGRRLLDTVAEEGKVLSAVAVQSCLALLSLSVFECQRALGLHGRLFSRKGKKEKECYFDDPASVANLVDVIHQLSSLLSLHSESMKTFYTQVLATTDARALLSASKKARGDLEEIKGACSAIHKAGAFLEKIADEESSSSEKSNSSPSPLFIVRLELLRTLEQLSASSVSSSSTASITPLYTAISSAVGHIQLADEELFAHLLSDLSLPAVAEGNLPKLFSIFCKCFSAPMLSPSSSTASATPSSVSLSGIPCQTPNTILRVPVSSSALATLISSPTFLFNSHPLVPLVTETLRREYAQSWLKTFISAGVRMAECLIVTITQKRVEKEMHQRSLGEKDSFLGVEAVFSQRDDASQDRLMQAELSALLKALLSLTGTPANANGVDTQSSSLSPSSSSSSNPKEFLPLHPTSLGRAADPDGVVHLPSGDIDITGYLSNVLSRFLCAYFAHCASSDNAQPFNYGNSSALITKLAADCPYYASLPRFAVFDPQAPNKLKRLLEEFDGTSSAEEESEATPMQASTPSPESDSGKGKSVIPAEDKEPILKQISIEAVKPSEWWNPPVSPPSASASSNVKAKGKKGEKGGASVSGSLQESEWPVSPSMCLSSICCCCENVKHLLQSSYPLLPVVAVAQRVLLHLCHPPSTAPMPASLLIDGSMPVSVWMHRLFGAERSMPSVDATAFQSAEGDEGDSNQRSVSSLVANSASSSTLPAVAASASASAHSKAHILENSVLLPARGYLTELYSRFYCDTLCREILLNSEAPVVFSRVEGGFIPMPVLAAAVKGPTASGSASSSATANYQIAKRIEQIASGRELQFVGMLLGPLGTEYIASSIEREHLARCVGHIGQFVKDQKALLDSIDSAKNTAELSEKCETSLKQLKGKEKAECLAPLLSAGSGVCLVEQLRKGVHFAFVTQHPVTASTLRSIAASQTSQELHPHSTLSSVCDMYALPPTSADTDTFVRSLAPTAAHILPASLCSTSSAPLLGRRRRGDAPFFAYVSHIGSTDDAQKANDAQREVCKLLPQALTLCLFSIKKGDVQSSWIDAMGGFENNLHVLAEGIVFSVDAMGCAEQKDPASPSFGSSTAQEQTEEDVIAAAAAQPLSSVGLLMKTIESVKNVTVGELSKEEQAKGTLNDKEKALLVLEEVCRAVGWQNAFTDQLLHQRTVRANEKLARKS
ncbi:uncharacterized protein MONOS_385 [Monocercomonoides exilis]|uniref:uncharacterized protein n=1 Tax=Monocercomonoides exilis TaxID=2049356 RepID=UPI00355A6F9A|nr:hypothetical protein MONOS_385 [Monocercomonoides exilis]|eukprot:MONOS_385.1-p1 / transcript=MONOS_385.1 / gene=MONOS_385 / organism=Monocercomonoides_exilis_PA203 / gene_product=unspecified product / transcript_product=unspecified product / location=Mono_scaffold00006:155456-159574(+) / protein_length=1372 / sequence_SO=supercontig / SO=protein_coding / is_pseudo=false